MQARLQPSFERRGIAMVTCSDGNQALDRWRASVPYVVLPDLSLPGRDGLQVLANARAEGLATPVIIVTACGTVGGRILGLNTGADDYLPKPFDLDELEARVRALARRGGGGGGGGATGTAPPNRPPTPPATARCWRRPRPSANCWAWPARPMRPGCWPARPSRRWRPSRPTTAAASISRSAVSRARGSRASRTCRPGAARSSTAAPTPHWSTSTTTSTAASRCGWPCCCSRWRIKSVRAWRRSRSPRRWNCAARWPARF